jgi:hypothetical protein
MTTGNFSSASLWSGRVLTALVTLVMIAMPLSTCSIRAWFRPRWRPLDSEA